MLNRVLKLVSVLCLLSGGMVYAAPTSLNVNTATAEQLSVVKGIGPKKAQAIVEYRQVKGPFQKIEDLRHVKGIGEHTLSVIEKDTEHPISTAVP